MKQRHPAEHGHFFVEIFRDDLVRGFVFEIRLPGLAAVLGLPPNDPLFLSSAQATSLLLSAAALTAYVVLLRRSLRPGHGHFGHPEGGTLH